MNVLIMLVLASTLNTQPKACQLPEGFRRVTKSRPMDWRTEKLVWMNTVTFSARKDVYVAVYAVKQYPIGSIVPKHRSDIDRWNCANRRVDLDYCKWAIERGGLLRPECERSKPHQFPNGAR